MTEKQIQNIKEEMARLNSTVLLHGTLSAKTQNDLKKLHEKFACPVYWFIGPCSVGTKVEISLRMPGEAKAYARAEKALFGLMIEHMKEV